MLNIIQLLRVSSAQVVLILRLIVSGHIQTMLTIFTSFSQNYTFSSFEEVFQNCETLRGEKTDSPLWAHRGSSDFLGGALNKTLCGCFADAVFRVSSPSEKQVFLGLRNTKPPRFARGFCLVGVRRLELPTPTSRTWYATNCATPR